MQKIQHKLGAPLYIFASKPIEAYDQLLGVAVPIVAAQNLGYIAAATMRSKNADGPVLGQYTLTWPTVDLWRLKLDTTGLNFKAGDAVVDIKIMSPTGDIMISETYAYELIQSSTR